MDNFGHFPGNRSFDLTNFNLLHQKSLDSIIAAAAGGIYLYGEISATFKDKELRKKIEAEYKKQLASKEWDGQQKALQAQKKGYQELLKTTEQKKNPATSGSGGLCRSGGGGGDGPFRRTSRPRCLQWSNYRFHS